ncbi:MAG: HAMP domain-containing histidine kinase [Bacilli bacterium]|nr:HAMP domain-containing histidine kinase [Bacilli bacterium]
MDKLKNKTFYTIFSIISLFILVTTIVFNIQSYQKEYNGIKTNLTRMNRMFFETPNKKPIIKDQNDKIIIMDYNFYTFILDRNNNIINQISHNENNFNNEITSKARQIISNNYRSNIRINNLYFSNTSYNFKSGEYLVIVDTSNIRTRLSIILLITCIIIALSELAVYYISKEITKWITNPVEESFSKQKDFIADASHELKTPLAVIMASIDCIETNKKNEKYINNIKSESDRMNNLITKLLDLSKSEKGINKELYSLNNLSKIVEKRVLVFDSLAYEINVTIEQSITKDIKLKCSEQEIDEVVSILIDNAIKHSFKNSVIKVNLYKDKNQIILEITNNGKDIPEDELDKIFERFYRSDKSRNRDSNRYGLGLAIAKNIVNNHNGEIKVFSKNNTTTFRVIFK